MLKTRFNKDPPKEDQFKDLLVFGYSSKLFRDDEKAIEIDRGRHLIPWMGDDTLLIDRYDGRGHLDDVRLFTSDSIFESIMTEEEKAREKELDEERYMDLYIDVEQKLLNEEEEMKRAKESEIRYGAVSFQYDDDDDDDQEPEEAKQQEADGRHDDCNDEFEAFVPHEGLNLPPGMITPRTTKHHKIIEKTALFISKQTLQMEILVKTRQKDNPAFNFMNFDDPLYAYYKHMLAEMKQGRYIPQLDKLEEDVKKEEPQHVEIQISSQEFLKSVEEKLPPRLVRDTCYDKLLNNLRKHIPVQPPAPPPPPVEVPKETTPPSPQDIVESQAVAHDTDKSSIVPPPPDKKFLIDKMAAYVSRNGPDFEVVVKMKNDPRFDFIAEGHVWNNYYKMRKVILEKEKKPTLPNSVRPAEKSPEKTKVSKPELKSICFSIKTKEAMEKVHVQNILGEEETGADKGGEIDFEEQSAIDPCYQSSFDIQISGTREYQPMIQALPVQAPVLPINNGDSSSKNKRSHSPDPVSLHKKQKSSSRSPECLPKPSLPEDAPKYEIPIYGPKTHLTVFEPKPPSPVYGPELPPKEYLDKLVSQGAELQQTSSKLPPRDASQSGTRAAPTNGLADRSGRSRELSSRRSSRRRSRSRSRRSRSRRRRSPEKRRSRSRRRSRTPERRRRDRSKSPVSRRSGSRSTKRFRLPRSPETERRRSPSRSKSRESRRKSSKKSKHHKRHHKHHHHSKDEKSDKLVVLDLTSEDVVDLTED